MLIYIINVFRFDFAGDVMIYIYLVYLRKIWKQIFFVANINEKKDV